MPSFDSTVEAAFAPSDAPQIIQQCRTLFLQRLRQLALEAERYPEPALKAFVEGVGSFFDDMVQKKGALSFAEIPGLRAANIRLLDEDSLALDIRLNDFSAHLQDCAGAELWPVHLRLMTLLSRSELAKTENPLGPKGIAQGLNRLCAALDESTDRQRERINHLEHYFAEHLRVLYAELDAWLEQRGVTAATPGRISAPETASGKAAHAGGAAAMLQQNLLGVSGLVGGQHAGIPGGGAGGQLFSQAMLERLLLRLDAFFDASATAVHAARDSALNSASTVKVGETATALPRLDAASLGIERGAPEAATIDALALIFDAIFASTQLPDAIKTALASLQIPLLKAAMRDPGVFTQAQHPGRQVLDKIAVAALSLARDAAPTQPLCRQLLSIADRVRQTYAGDPAVFIAAVQELDLLIAQRDRAAAEQVQRYLPLLDRFAQQGQAERRCQQLLAPYLAQPLPPAIAAFLRQEWQQVLVQLWLTGGEQDATWVAHWQVIDTLLWSIAPKDAEGRKKMASVLPPMLKLLDDGMQRAGIAEARRSACLDDFFALQSQALQGKVASSGDLASDRSPARLLWGCLRDGALSLRTVSVSAATAAPAAFVRVGDWLALSGPEGERYCARLSHVAPETQIQVLTHPDWSEALALAPGVFAVQLRDKQAAVLSGRSLFDAAAEKALRNTPKNPVLT